MQPAITRLAPIARCQRCRRCWTTLLFSALRYYIEQALLSADDAKVPLLSLLAAPVKGLPGTLTGPAPFAESLRSFVRNPPLPTSAEVHPWEITVLAVAEVRGAGRRAVGVGCWNVLHWVGTPERALTRRRRGDTKAPRQPHHSPTTLPLSHC